MFLPAIVSAGRQFPADTQEVFRLLAPYLDAKKGAGVLAGIANKSGAETLYMILGEGGRD